MSKKNTAPTITPAVETKKAFETIRIEDGLAALDAYAMATPPSKLVKKGPSAYLADPKIAEKVAALRERGYTAEQVSEAFRAAGIPISKGMVYAADSNKGAEAEANEQSAAEEAA